MAKPVARGFERGFCGAQIGARLREIGLRGLEVAQRPRLAFVQRAVLLFDDLGDRDARARAVDAGERGEEIVLRLHHVGGFDEEQRLAGLDRVAGLGHQPGHPPGIGRIDRRRMILVDRDLAFGHVLGAERLGRHRLDAERRPLLGVGRIGARVRLAWLDTSMTCLTGNVATVLRRSDNASTTAPAVSSTATTTVGNKARPSAKLVQYSA